MAMAAMARLWRLDRKGTLSRRVVLDHVQHHLDDTSIWKNQMFSPSPRRYFISSYSCPPAFTTTRPFQIVPQRGFATRQVKVNLYLSSPGIVAEPYRKPPPPLPFFQRWFTRQGWRLKKKYFLEMLKTAYCLAKLRKKHKGYTQKMFYREVTDLYKEINKNSAAGDVGKLRRFVTENFLSVLKNQIKQREAAYSRVHWEMVGPIKKMRTLQGRMIGIDKNDLDNAFVQITVRIQSNQIFAAYDKKDNLIKGDLEKPLFVEDIWIFEKHLTRPESTWRLCGQLNL